MTATADPASGRSHGPFGNSQIFNTDQGSQFTSTAFIGPLERAGIQISMDGRGRWMDNVFIERLWRSLKHARMSISRAMPMVASCTRGFANWIAFYPLAHRQNDFVDFALHRE
jgi:putative transposase